MPEERRVIILGLDGVSLSDLENIASRGGMPFISWLLKRAAKNEPNVLIPYTAPSWTTVATGVNPGKHGIFDFVKPSPTNEFKPVGPNDIMYPRINEILAFNKLPSITLNLVLSYPPLPRKRETIVIPSWSSLKLKTWPPHISKLVKNIVGMGPPKALTIDSYVEEISTRLENRINTELELAGKFDWKLYFTVFSEPDWIFHKAYTQFMKNGKPKAAQKTFKLIDSFLKKLYESSPAETMIILASDHGFAEVKTFVNVNMVLKKMGLLKIKQQKGLKGALLKTIFTILQRLPYVKHRVKYKALRLMEALNFKPRIGKDPLTSPVDYQESIAYMPTPYYIYINKKLNKNTKTRVSKKIVMELKKVGEYFKVLEAGKEFFKGPYSHNAPDIVIIPKEGFTTSARLLSRKIIDKGTWNIHSSKGLAVVYTSDINKEKPVRITQLDLVPTALSYLGVPLPHDLDGHFVPGIIKPHEKKLRRRDYVSIYRNLRRLHKKIHHIAHKTPRQSKV